MLIIIHDDDDDDVHDPNHIILYIRYQNQNPHPNLQPRRKRYRDHPLPPKKRNPSARVSCFYDDDHLFWKSILPTTTSAATGGADGPKKPRHGLPPPPGGPHLRRPDRSIAYGSRRQMPLRRSPPKEHWPEDHRRRRLRTTEKVQRCRGSTPNNPLYVVGLERLGPTLYIFVYFLNVVNAVHQRLRVYKIIECALLYFHSANIIVSIRITSGNARFPLVTPVVEITYQLFLVTIFSTSAWL